VTIAGKTKRGEVVASLLDPDALQSHLAPDSSLSRTRGSEIHYLSETAYSAHTASHPMRGQKKKNDNYGHEERDVALSIPITCTKCGNRLCQRDAVKTVRDHISRLVGWHPWWCPDCSARFYLRRF
jgi:hypothetical protein